ncbi:hypothetical protein HKX48_007633 [Thoreauomyces humboldtii]|nr:hypothetical protein HKX48_007633 [Thoreauomyces humboldtii]
MLHKSSSLSLSLSLVTSHILVGCGAPFQNIKPGEAGYRFEVADDKKASRLSVHAQLDTAGDPDILTPAQVKALLKPKLATHPICQRCHRLRHHNAASRRHFPTSPSVLLAPVRVRTSGLVICVIDTIDFPASLARQLPETVGTDKDLIIVANKADLLPVGITQEALQSRILKDTRKIWGDSARIRRVIVTSAVDGSGLSDVGRAIADAQAAGTDVFLVGCANVGKSALISGISKMAGLDPSKGPTTSMMPGTTVGMVPIPLDLKALFPADKSDPPLASETADTTNSSPTSPGTLYDTPGLYSTSQITHLLTQPELALSLPSRTLVSRPHALHPHQTVFVGGLLRIDVAAAEAETTPLVFYLASQLSLHVCRTDRAQALYDRHIDLDDKLMTPPIASTEGGREFPPLEACRTVEVTRETGGLDVCFGGLGWMYVPGPCTLNIMSPGGAQVVGVRAPLIKDVSKAAGAWVKTRSRTVERRPWAKARRPKSVT